MIMNFSIALLAVLIAIYELPSLLREKSKRGVWLFSSLLMLGTTIIILQNLKVSIPNPIDWITFIFEPVARLVDEILGVRRR